MRVSEGAAVVSVFVDLCSRAAVCFLAVIGKPEVDFKDWVTEQTEQ